MMALMLMAKKHTTLPSAPPHGSVAMRPDLETRRRVTTSISQNSFDPIDSERLARRLEAIPGVYSVYIGLQTEMAHIVYNPSLVDLRTRRLLINTQG
jgi:hypothetical protein